MNKKAAAPESAVQALAIVEPTAGPMAAYNAAVARGPVDTAHLKELLILQRDWEAGEARKAFNKAFAAFKSEAVRIVKNTPVNDGPLKGKKYADLFDIVNGVTEPLAKHGLSASWRLTKDEKDWMEVTCILRHSDGHSESDAQGGAPDTGPGRNAIQARRSTRTYLEKSTLTGVTGLAAQGADDDGAGGELTVKLITADQAKELSALIESTGADKARFLAYVSDESKVKVAAVEEIPANFYASAVATLNAAAKAKAKKAAVPA